jgi:hypothetical protein
MNQTNLDSLVSYVRVLSGEDSVQLGDSTVLIQDRRYNESKILAAGYLKQKLEDFGIEASEQIYSDNGRNIIGIQTGTIYPDSILIICAHFDAVTNYCADDDASGVAAVLESARILSKYQLTYTLVYALWDEEEAGIIGSRYYVSQAVLNKMNIKGVLNLEMFGWDGDDDGVMDIHTSDISSSRSLSNLVFNTISIYDLPLIPVIHDPGAGGSDHWAFWNEGFGAIVIGEAYWGGDFSPYYHSTEDRIDKFNLSYFYNLSKLTLGSISTLAVVIEDNSSPVEFAEVEPQNYKLYQNYPNPYNSTTTIPFEIRNRGFIKLIIYNSVGQKVQVVLEKMMAAGFYEIQVNTLNLSSGIYFYRLISNTNFIMQRKMLLIK